MNYQTFKNKMSEFLLFDPSDFGEQEMNDLYTQYKSDDMYKKMSIDEWFNFFFQGFSMESHGVCLKSNL